MISVSEAKALVDSHTHQRSTVHLPLLEAFGLTLSENVVANYDIPFYAQSSMDGYAYAFADKESKLKITGEMVAGSGAPFSINKNEATRIFTGAPLPEGADTVVMQEKSIVNAGYLQVDDAAAKKGIHVRARGAEIKAGEIAMTKNQRLTVAALGFLAGIGVTTVPVYAPVHASVILTGNELQTPGSPLTFGKVYESNSVILCVALRQAGVSQIDTYKVSDDPVLLREILENALSKSDLVLLTGGVSVGDYDFVAKVAAESGIHTRFHKVKQRPGKPLFFGTQGKKLVFGLPGNPSSALTCYYMYVLPAIARLMSVDCTCPVVEAELTNDFQKPTGLTQFVKSSYSQGKVSILHAQESFRLHSFAQANALAELDEDRDSYKAGESIKVHLITT